MNIIKKILNKNNNNTNNKIKNQFKLLESGKEIYMDSACNTLRPNSVIKEIIKYYEEYPVCAGRSSHKLSQKLNEKITNTRKNINKLFNAKKHKTIFTKNCTESINLIANSLTLKKNDIIITSQKEHNSNHIPWLKLAKEKGIIVKQIQTNLNKNSENYNSLNLENLNDLIKKYKNKIKLISTVHISNADGVENNISEISKIANENNIQTMFDCAQSSSHSKIDIKKLNCDFITTSSHKMFGPSGVGILTGKTESLKKLNQFLVGGSTVADSTTKEYEPLEIPEKFEAGLQNYEGICGLNTAIEFINKQSLNKIHKKTQNINKIITKELENNNKIEIFGPQNYKKRNNILSFNIKNKNIHEISQMLSQTYNISTRSGTHCVHSFFNQIKHNGTIRASFQIYNDETDAEKFIDAINTLSKL